MGRRFNDLLETCDFGFGKAGNVLPLVPREVTGCIMKASLSQYTFTLPFPRISEWTISVLSSRVKKGIHHIKQHIKQPPR